MRGGGGLQLKAALVGRFETEVENAQGNIQRALGQAMEDVASALVSKLRQDIASSQITNGARLQSIWSVRYYALGKSMSPAAWVYSRFPLIQAAFEDAPTIRAKSGRFLLMPNPDVWPGGRLKKRRGQRGSNAPAAIAEAERRFGPLQFVRLRNGNGILVAQARESRTRPGIYRKASATAVAKLQAGKASGLASIVVFFLVRQARLPRLLRGAVIRRRAETSLPGDLALAFERRFTGYDPAGPRQLAGPFVAPVNRGGGFSDWETI